MSTVPGPNVLLGVCHEAREIAVLIRGQPRFILSRSGAG